MKHHNRNGFQAITRRSLLGGFGALGAAVAARPALATTGGPKVPKNIIWFFANGGWDVTFCTDPKLGVPYIEGPEVDERASDADDVNVVTTYAGGVPIVTNESRRPNVSRFFEANAQDVLVLNGIWTGSIVHEGCRMRILTGNSTAAVPDLPTQIGHRYGDGLPLGSVDMSGLGYAGIYAASTGRVGVRSQIKTLLDPASVFQASPDAGYTLPLYKPSDKSRTAVDDYLRARAAQLQAGWTDGAVNDQRVSDLLQAMDRRELLIGQSTTLTQDLTVSTEPTLATQAVTAVELLKAGMCRAVLVSDPTSWDTHDLNELQHGNYDYFFAQLGILVDSLREADLFDDTLVVVASEMTRTPRRNWKTGKDHWAHTSMMLLGAGIRGGRTIGATDDSLESLPVDLDTGEPFYDREKYADAPLMKYDNLAAGILELFDIDPEELYPTIPPLRALKG